jgi:predicted AlkP superfamily pyrophosphatase or phosphodiesterase
MTFDKKMKALFFKKVLTAFMLIFIIPDTFSQENQQHVILISLDGFRWDYVERFNPPNIVSFLADGTAAESMLSSFPSKTFPNHYSIATGMKPETHGLVDNSFYDRSKDKLFEIRNREVVQDGSWYGGTPIWVLAGAHGIKTASYFFVGTEAPVQGVQPDYFYNYDGGVANMTRIKQVLEWLALPDDERPRLITLYFSDMDDIGHRYGPDNDSEISAKLYQLDQELGKLFDGLKTFDLNINVVLVSDHGMTAVKKENLINLDFITEGIDARVVNNGATAHIYLNDPGKSAEVLEKLKSKTGSFKVVAIEDQEYYQNITSHAARLGDILLIPDLGSYLVTSAGMMNYQMRTAQFQTDTYGEHGFNPEYKDMHGIFYARGPMIKKGLTIPSFENIHVYPLLATLLSLPLPKDIDGNVHVLQHILQIDEDETGH